MQPERSFELYLVALCENGLPGHDTWTSELQGAGLEIEVHPARHRFSVHDCLVPMSVRGHLAPVDFGLATKKHHDWFPPEISRDHGPEALQLVFTTNEDNKWDATWERAAHWAAAGSLLSLGAAVVFDKLGLRRDSPEVLYARARSLMAELTPQPHPDPSVLNPNSGSNG